MTSSHNPYQWNGIKVKPDYGGSASPEIVADIEERVPAILADPARPKLAAADDAAITRFDPVPGYLAGLARQVDLDRIRGAGLRVAVDPMSAQAQAFWRACSTAGRRPSRRSTPSRTRASPASALPSRSTRTWASCSR